MWWKKKDEKSVNETNTFHGYSQIPSRLNGIHPNSNSFWGTAEFYIRLGEECAKITNNQYVCNFFIKPNGDFSCNFFDADSAKSFFPALTNDIQSSCDGTDKQITHPMYTSSKICEIMQDDGPSAHISGTDYPDGKSITVSWH